MDIIAKGPESIDSQFNVSYGMVLNLLSTRRLDDCRTFLDRSFLRYQGTAGHVAALQEAQRLECAANELLATIGAAESSDIIKQFETSKVCLKPSYAQISCLVCCSMPVSFSNLLIDRNFLKQERLRGACLLPSHRQLSKPQCIGLSLLSPRDPVHI